MSNPADTSEQPGAPIGAASRNGVQTSGGRFWHRLARGLTLAVALLLGYAAWIEPGWYAGLFALNLVVLAYLPVYLLTRRPWFAVLVASLPLVAVYLISRVKWHFLQTPLLFFDARYLTGTNLFDVAIVYVSLSIGIGVTLVLMLAMLALVYRQDRPHSQLHWPSVVVWLFLWPPAHLLYQRLAAHDFSSTANPWEVMAAYDRVFESFFMSAVHREPLLQPVAAEFGPLTQSLPAKPPAVLPDLVAVLQESAFDPNRLLGFCAKDACANPRFFAAPVRGDLQVHTFGGGTWMSEFAFLVGLPHKNLGPSGYYTPHTMLGRVWHSLPRYLHQLGYATLAIYPIEGGFINARAFYESIGFDEFLDLTEIGLHDEKYSLHVPDKELFDAFLGQLPEIRARHPRKPLFIFLLTLAQHGPHGDMYLPPHTLPHPRIPADYPLNERLALTDYLRRMDVGARAQDELRNALEKSSKQAGRRLLYLHWGDHHPGLSGDLRKDDFTLDDAEYTTYFSLTGADRRNLEPALLAQRLDIAYLSTLLLKAAGLPLDPVFQLRLEAWRQCQGRYFNCDQPIIGRLHRLLIGQGLLKVSGPPAAESSVEAASDDQPP